jgi:hypothetical protein
MVVPLANFQAAGPGDTPYNQGRRIKLGGFS